MIKRTFNMRGAWSFGALGMHTIFQLFFLKLCFAEKILVLVSQDALSNSHSKFLGLLDQPGLEVDQRLISDPKLQLQSWGSWLYDGVVILSKGSGDFGGAVDSTGLVEFVDAGGSLFIATDEKPTDSIRDAASQLGAEFLDPGAEVKDFVSYASGQTASHLLTTALYPSPVMTGDPGNPILYRGGALTTSPDSALSMSALKSSPTAVVTSSTGTLTGPEFALAVTMQSRTNARFCVIASLEALSDSAFSAQVELAATRDTTSTGNQPLATALLYWTLKLQGVLKHSHLSHHRVGEPSPPMHNTYTVNDEITIEVELLERVGGKWVPHVTDSLLAQFVMLDPYVRQPMQHQGEGQYALSIRAPDVYGVFKWVVDYKAPGYTFLKFEEVTPLRPLRHDQYPRFILQAYPYYTALVSVSAAFAVTIAVVMFQK